MTRLSSLTRILFFLFIISINLADCKLKKKQNDYEEADQLLSELENKINEEEKLEDINNVQKSTSTKSSSSTSKSSTSQTTTESQVRSESEIENTNSWTMFFILCILGLSILVIHVLIETKFHYLPESVAVVFLGAIIGLIFKLLSHYRIADWSKEETFTPTMFFLVLLPPIIFESGYNLHKGNFFQNIGSILVFAIFGTAISAFVMGAGVYVLGKLNLTYSLNARESFAFGSLVSAVDPVATLAIFNALDMDPVLYMLVFGESILNDAVAIVLTNTIMTSDMSLGLFYIIGNIISKFCLMFFASAAIGCLFGLTSALLFKYIDLRKTPSLETAFMFIFMYSPYVFAEAIHLSGIMAILFAGLIMSHYTHLNLSSVTRITVQQIFRTLAFVAETCVFAYLGLAIFSFKHIFKPSLVISSILMCLLGRACNIFPLSILLNYFREHKITRKMQFIMWFSGLRGAIAFALSLNLDLDNETRHVIVTSTLILVLFTTLVLGGSTMPLMKFMNAERNSNNNRRKQTKFVFLSKTKEMGEAVDPFNEDETNSNLPLNSDNDASSAVNIHIVRSDLRLRGFARLDEAFLKPFFTRTFTDEELRTGQSDINRLTKQWFDDANRDGKFSTNSSSSTVHFKKATNRLNGLNLNNNDKPLMNKNVQYHKLTKNNTTSSSNILLESTDEEENEDMVIDKTTSFIN